MKGPDSAQPFDELADELFLMTDLEALLKEPWFGRLRQAVEERRYPALYALLRRPERELTPVEAFQLCAEALKQDLTARAFGAILDHSPPLERVLHCGAAGRHDCGLVEQAAVRDREDILDLLLRRGGSANRDGRRVSPLEAAMEAQALHSVERLLREPELDTTLTPRLLNCWSFADSGLHGLDFCLQAAAPRLLGKEPSFRDPIPIPDQLTAVHAVKAQNWNLVRRLCGEREISAQEGRKALGAFPMWLHVCGEGLDEWDRAEVIGRAGALDSLLTACPALLRGERASQLLIYYALQYHGEVQDTLAPWLAHIRRRTVRLDRVLGECCSGQLAGARLRQTLRLWREYLPDGPRPAIDRHTVLCDFLAESITPDEVEFVFQSCVFLPKRRPNPGAVSDLAFSLLRCGPPRLIEEQFRPGGVLAGEETDALLRFCQAEECPRELRGLILAHIKQEVDYAL